MLNAFSDLSYLILCWQNKLGPNCVCAYMNTMCVLISIGTFCIVCVFYQVYLFCIDFSKSQWLSQSEVGRLWNRNHMHHVEPLSLVCGTPCHTAPEMLMETG